LYKVTIQNTCQYYFSLQNHFGKRISLALLEFKVYNHLNIKEAEHYKKYIPLGLSVIIEQEPLGPFIIIEQEAIEVQGEIVDVEDIVEISDEVNSDVVEVEVKKYVLEELEELKKAELRELADKEGLNHKGLTKAEIIELLVNL
jgi:hypothetical protein